jgi:hypothetical protein
MCLKEAFAYQRDNAGIEYKINKLDGKYTHFNAQKPVIRTGILGPDS